MSGGGCRSLRFRRRARGAPVDPFPGLRFTFLGSRGESQVRWTHAPYPLPRLLDLFHAASQPKCGRREV
eukprot:3873881-Prymnesium_polylepis.1